MPRLLDVHLAEIEGHCAGVVVETSQALDHLEIAERIDARTDACAESVRDALAAIRRADSTADARNLAAVAITHLDELARLDALEDEHYQVDARERVVLAQDEGRAGVGLCEAHLTRCEEADHAA